MVEQQRPSIFLVVARCTCGSKSDGSARSSFHISRQHKTYILKSMGKRSYETVQRKLDAQTAVHHQTLVGQTTEKDRLCRCLCLCLRPQVEERFCLTPSCQHTIPFTASSCKRWFGLSFLRMLHEPPHFSARSLNVMDSYRACCTRTVSCCQIVVSKHGTLGGEKLFCSLTATLLVCACSASLLWTCTVWDVLMHLC